MKASQAKPALPPQPPRSFSLGARFCPDGPDPAASIAFVEFSQAAYGHLLKLKETKLAGDQAQLAKRQVATRKAISILLQGLRHGIPAAAAAQQLKELVPDRAMLTEILALCKTAPPATPESAARAAEEQARRTQRIEHLERLHKAQKGISCGLASLAEGAAAGDAEAAGQLADAAIAAATLLTIAECIHPELFQLVARQELVWPALATDAPAWEEAASGRIAALGLGTGLREQRAAFRQPRGADANLPARRWAKAAVRTLELTQQHCRGFGQIRRGFGSSEALLHFCLQAGWRMSETPGWVSEAAQLGSFSARSLPQWKRAVRALIREQMPDFQMLPDWSTQRNTAAANGRGSAGEIRNAILDDICSALERLVPGPNLPKSTC